MTLRNQKSVIWPPAGLSDMLDASSEDFQGACALLQNLIPAQNNRGMMVARPAATQLAQLPDYAGGPLTCEVAIGSMIYGMYASAAFPGKDRPFAYNLATNSFASIAGLTSGNLPTSQPTSGDWTAPTADQIGTRVLFTHPGFPGGNPNDIPTLYTGTPANTVNGSDILTGFPFGADTQVPVGLRLFGAGIPANTTLVSWTPANIVVNASYSGSGNTFTVASATGLAVGQPILFQNGQTDTIGNIAGTTITLATLASLTGGAFSGQATTFLTATAVMSQNATATANNIGVFATSPAAVKFGWLDVSNFSTQIVGNTVIANAITGGFSTAGIQPGMTVSGTGIPAGTTVVGAIPVTFPILATLTLGSVSITSIEIIGKGFAQTPPQNNVMVVGQFIAGPGLPIGATVTGVSEPFGIPFGTVGSGVLSQAATSNETQQQFTISGSILILSQTPTATNNGLTFTVAGGSPTAPLWGAGDTQALPLPAVPVFVKQYAGSASFGVNTTSPNTAGVTFSDAGVPCQVTNASQALTFQGGVPVTAAAGLPLANQLGGIIQSLIVFQGASNIQQISGSVALGNITVNTSQVATGTFAPNSVASTTKGLIFAAPFGLRMITFDGNITDPIGSKGLGAVIPFQNVVTPTRMAAAFNENVYRITIDWLPPPNMQIVWGTAQREDEFWLHLDTGRFSGPHTCTMDLCAPWIGNESFVGALESGRGYLWRSDPDPEAASAYIENGVALTWTLQTALLPDDATMYANSLVESSVFGSMSGQSTWLASFIDDQGVTLDQTYIQGGPGLPLARQSQLPIYWINPIDFRQGSLQITGPSEPQTLIGNIELRYQKLKYPFTYRPQRPYVLGETSPLSGGNVGPSP